MQDVGFDVSNIDVMTCMDHIEVYERGKGGGGRMTTKQEEMAEVPPLLAGVLFV
jgi:hypothetical protein